MITKRRLTLFALQFPLTLILGVLIYFGYSMRVHDQPGVDWLVAILLGIVIDLVLTLLNKRDEKVHHQV